MPGRSYRCSLLETRWLSPTVLCVRFMPKRLFKYEPGQFIALTVPHRDGRSRPLKRAYSFSTPYEVACKKGYELCVKYVPRGAGSTYLKNLNPGDEFQIFAPYGDFRYRLPTPERSVCFISTSSGIAPFQSIALSKLLQVEAPPKKALCLFGARTESELLYSGNFEQAGVERVDCVSQPSADWKGFKGRVTDYLKTLPPDWEWHSTDFYLCGNGAMIQEVERLLKGGHGVPETAIFKEAFSATAKALSLAA